MPPKVERCVDALLKRSTFKPNASKKERESSAWAICKASVKNEYASDIYAELPLDVDISLSDDNKIVLSEIEGHISEDVDQEYSDEASNSTICSVKKDSGANKFFTFSEIELAKSRDEEDEEEDKDEDEEDEEYKLVELEVLREGKFEHPWYGPLDFNKKYFLSVVQNFLNDTIQREVSFDSSHMPTQGAVAWVKKLGIIRRKFKDSHIKHVLTAAVELTDWGKSLVEGKQFKYFSSEVDHNYIDRETSKEFGPTMLGGGLTNRPFITGMLAVQMSEDAPVIPDNKDNAEPGRVALSGGTGSEGQSNSLEEVSTDSSSNLLSEKNKNSVIENVKETPSSSKLPDAAVTQTGTVDSVKERAQLHLGPQVNSPTENKPVSMDRPNNARTKPTQARNLKRDAKASTGKGVDSMNELKERISALESRIATLSDTEKTSELGKALQEQLDFLNKQMDEFPAKLQEAQKQVAMEFQAKFENQTAKLSALETQVQVFENERTNRSINDRCDKLINDGHYPAAINKLRDIALSVGKSVTIKMSVEGKEKDVDLVEVMSQIFAALPDNAKVDTDVNLSDGDSPTKPEEGKDGPNVVQFGDTKIDLLSPERLANLMEKVSVKKPAN